jgi:maleamate amidohydrolase
MGKSAVDTSTGPVTWAETRRAMPHLVITLIAVAAHMMLFGMLTPVMAVYATGFGVPDWEIGLMITVFAAGRLTADLPAGYLAPRVGLRPLLGFGLLLCSVGALMAAMAPNYVVALLGRTLQGIGSGFFMTATMIYLAQKSDRRNRGKVMSMFQGATLIGGGFGPSVGGLAASLFGMQGPFYLAAIVGLVSGVLPLLLLSRDEVTVDTAPKHNGMATNLLLIVPFLCVLLANFGFFLTRTAGQWQLIPLLADQQFGIGPANIGFAMTLSAAANLATLPLAAWLVDRAPRPVLITLSLFATAAALMAIAFSVTPATLYVGMVAIGLAIGIGGPAIGAYAVDVVPQSQQGPAMGMLRFAGDLGYLVGPLAIGSVVDFSNIGYGGGLLINAAILVVFGAVFVLVGRRLTNTRSHEHSATGQQRRPVTMTERVWDKYLNEEDKAVFAASGFGSLAAWGKRPALLVIDVNYAFCDEAPTPILESIKKWRTSCGEYAWEAMPVLQTLIQTCHGKGIPVIYTTGTSRPDKWDAGSWAWKSSRRAEESPRTPITTSDGQDGNEIVADIAPGPRDIVIRKQKPSGFAGTPMMSYLQLLGCDSVIVTGTTTSGCVRATVLDAFSLNYRVTVVEDGCFDRAQANHAINLCDMHAKYANVMDSTEVIAHLDTLSQGMYDLPSGLGMSQVAAE